jgi:hypothetical protein
MRSTLMPSNSMVWSKLTASIHRCSRTERSNAVSGTSCLSETVSLLPHLDAVDQYSLVKVNHLYPQVQ